MREWVNEIIACLAQMLRTGNINEDILVNLQIVADFGYAWGPLIDGYTSQMQSLIQKNPAAVSELRAVFLKVPVEAIFSFSDLSIGFNQRTFSVARVSHGHAFIEIEPSQIT